MDLKEFFRLLSSPIRADICGFEWTDSRFTRPFFASMKKSFFEAQEEAQFLRSLLSSQGKFLDLGGGGYRLYDLLSATHFGVVIDKSFESLIPSRGSSVAGDLLKIPVSEPFDLVLLAFGQVCFYQEKELEEIFVQILPLLSSDGYLYVDLPTLRLAEEFDSMHEWMEFEEDILFYTREYDPQNSRFLQRQLSFGKKSGEFLHCLEFAYQMYSFYSLADLFSRVGLEIVQSFEDFSFQKIREDSSWMVFVLKKSH